MIIRNIERAESAEWERMRCDLWPDGADDHTAEIESFFAETLPEPQAVFVAVDNRTLVGVVELSVRRDIPGFHGKRVGYVEGLYVLPAWRGQGIARQLLAASKVWAKQNTCETFASDRADRVIIDRRF